MNNVTLRQLRYFQALAQHGHFGHAAEQCAISQPAMSVQIRELEENLGAPLFERTARRVRLTPLGEALEVRVRDILRAVGDLGDLARAEAGRVPDRLRIGIIPTVAPYLLPKMVQRLTRLNPALDLHVRETQTNGLLEELGQGRLDAAVVALPVSDAAFTEAPLFDEDFVLVRPQADADKPVPDGEALRQMRLLLLEEGHCFRDQALSFCATPTSIPRDGLDGSSLTTLVQMVGAGIGVTLIPEMAIALETSTAPVSVARFADPVPKRTIGMIWRRTNPLDSQLHGIADVLRGLTPA
ncbi:LysR family transcriptional regulator, hydrogen peroxide-inducible genes activator [Monaibacterium marinum]|uniref:LysR family transcriptional regulator, hydrogen peroxide-inducible genes activator n=1 Tax=Pontivivens marinum TaxID=1690039 RepID=A0A2C9CUE2_9RHOB|nr:LysR substrate-binding domain-containing protein [Monaibacterium marinum]SOH94833.1 LysR family transcriptional regulator, hydrogen peroxide-inducible genes activator [Monaibacterium marinum]